MKKIKKGQSVVISTILLISIVIIVAGIIVVVATTFVKKETTKQTFITKVTNKIKISILEIYQESDSYGYYGVNIIINRKDNEDLPESKGVSFIFHLISGKTVTFDSAQPLPQSGMSSNYLIKYSDIQITNSNEIEKIEIEGIYEEKNTGVLAYETEID